MTFSFYGKGTNSYVGPAGTVFGAHDVYRDPRERPPKRYSLRLCCAAVSLSLRALFFSRTTFCEAGLEFQRLGCQLRRFSLYRVV